MPVNSSQIATKCNKNSFFLEKCNLEQVIYPPAYTGDFAISASVFITTNLGQVREFFKKYTDEAFRFKMPVNSSQITTKCNKNSFFFQKCNLEHVIYPPAYNGDFAISASVFITTNLGQVREFFKKYTDEAFRFKMPVNSSQITTKCNKNSFFFQKCNLEHVIYPPAYTGDFAISASVFITTNLGQVREFSKKYPDKDFRFKIPVNSSQITTKCNKNSFSLEKCNLEHVIHAPAYTDHLGHEFMRQR